MEGTDFVMWCLGALALSLAFAVVVNVFL